MCVLGFRPFKLYDICLLVVGKILKLIVQRYSESEAQQYSRDLFSKIGTRIIEDLMMKTYYDQETWNDVQDLFLYGRITRLICKWDKDLFTQLDAITSLKQIFIVESPSKINIHDIIAYTGKYTSVDFDGELFWRSESYDDYMMNVFNRDNISWLSTSQDIIRYLITCRQKLPKYIHQDTYHGLLELHLGTLTITTSDIATILISFPNLLILRNYKLVKALYEMYNEEWKSSGIRHRYQLRNLDADFSYVGRCTLAVQPMLPLDALQLATELCPEAHTIRVRFDCSTHHDILLPLTNLHKVKDLSVVCVTNGERSLMDFTDIEPILRHHGNNIKSLELKVIDEVDTHVITRFCPKLEVLILSGSNYVTPHTCVSYQCSQTNPTTTTSNNSNRSKNNNNISNLTKLRIFFFAEGDNTVCNNVPQCFWYSTLKPSDESGSRLTSIFLESPRILESQANQIFNSCTVPSYPNMQIISISDYNELDVTHLNSLTSGDRIKYLHISRCQKLQPHHVKRWQHRFNRSHILIHVN
ncbi:uncharacterized protein LOC135832510 [Planococcus citri]|uniref:uncharacterized protein LOC135832510 n=1 Tax=Planococcus citri TaxID=170843 RepID=UPI0031F7872F